MRALLLTLLLAAPLAGCGEDPAPASAAADAAPTDAAPAADEMLADVDPADLDASRIVVLGGPIAETVYALGLGDRVVGTDQSSLYPASVLDKPRLNYFRQTSAEGVLSLEPTLVLATDDTGPPAVLGQIEASGVRVVRVPSPVTIDQAVARVRALGRVLGRQAEADSLVGRMQRQLADAEALRPATPPRVLFVYARGAGLVQVMGAGTGADLVLRLAGAENAVSVEGDVPLTAEAVVAAQPDVVVIPSRGLESLGGPEGLFAQPGLAQTPAGEALRVVAVDDALLLGFGPRVGEAVAELARALSQASAEPSGR